jgi:glucosylceramidase
MVPLVKVFCAVVMGVSCAGSSMQCVAQAGRGVDVWLSKADRSALVAEQSKRLAFEAAGGDGAVIEVADDVKMQTMDGFGFAMTGGSAELLMKMSAAKRAAVLKELFGTGAGSIGVSYLRLSIGASDMNEKVFTYDDMPAGETDPELKHFALGPDMANVVPVMKEVLRINPRIAILASPWTPPSWMKTDEKPKAGSLKPELYGVYARYLVKYVKAMGAQGIRIKAITMQNEPLNPKNTPSLVMTAAEERDFLKTALGPALHKAGLKTDVILYDHNCDRPDYPLEVLADKDAAQYVKGSGFHLYGGTVDAMTKVHEAHPDKDLYFTEQMVTQEDEQAPLKLAEATSRVVIGATRNWSKNVLLWNLAADPKFGPHTDSGGCPVCQGAITIDGDKVTRELAFYTVAQVSKFVKPGAVRVQSQGPEELPNVAFATPEHKTVLLVANPGAAARSFHVKFHGREFAASLDAGDVATYVW